MLSTVVPKLLPPSLAVLATLLVALGALLVWPSEEADIALPERPQSEHELAPAPPLAGDPGAFAGPVTLTPVVERGRPAGFSLGEVARGSLFERMGLRAGDVLMSFNDLGDGDVPHLVVHLERAGRPMRLEYAAPPRASTASLLRPHDLAAP